MIKATYNAIRNMLGIRGVCIYPISCGSYAEGIFKQKPFYIAIPLIVIRVLSCNPITAIFRRFGC